MAGAEGNADVLGCCWRAGTVEIEEDTRIYFVWGGDTSRGIIADRGDLIWLTHDPSIIFSISTRR